MIVKSFKRKTFFLDSAITKMNEDGDVLKISGYASTVDKDRVGDIILPDAWTRSGGLDNFTKNPIILFNHNYNAPIGRATSIEVDERGLKLEAEISKNSPQYGLIKDGVLSTFSVGFMVRDADYNQTTDGFIIKDAELLETSVVTVPCNQDAVFSLSKSFENRDDFAKFKKEFVEAAQNEGQSTEEEVNTSVPKDGNAGIKNVQERKKVMDPEEVAKIQALAEAAAQKMFDAAEQKRLDAEKAVAAKAAEDARITTAVETAVKTNEEKLLGEFEKRLTEYKGDAEKAFGELKADFEEKAADFTKMRESKRNFSDRGGSDGDWKKEFAADIDDAFLLGRVTGKKYDTEFAKGLLEKVNAHSTVHVSSDAFETTVSTSIERDIQNDLVVTQLFREIQMNSANLTIPIMPDAGYAEITANTTASGTQPNGNMDRRGAPHGAPYEGITLNEITLNTIKMIALSFLGNETEEDAIMPILPLIRESMIRSHVRGVENMILAGNDVDGVYTSGAKDGLIKLARTAGRTVTTSAVDTPLTAATLFGMRRVMGKYGLNPRDIVYIISQQAYYELIADAEFQDVNLVGSDMATKLHGELGSVYGSKVIMSDEFAAPGAGRYHALALNKRNFVVPRLRGVTVESDYEVREQRRVLVTSQRLGFNEIIPDATSVVGLRYKTA